MSQSRTRLPQWLRVPFRGGRARTELRRLLRDLDLHTVCESARCPNLYTCWARRTATFMLLGDVCTRNCRFCAVSHGVPQAPDAAEPDRVAAAAREMGLRYVVLTSVTRDDLADGGAGHFAATVKAVRAVLPGAGIEVLSPDFGGRERDVAVVVDASPTVFNHNIETCVRLTAAVRPDADYRRSLSVLAAAARLGAGATLTKSGLMLGLGETAAEIRSVLGALRESGVTIVTLGQYLAPTPAHWPVVRYVTPAEFSAWAETARHEFGFAEVVSGPLVRSSYEAERAARGAARARLQGVPPVRED